LNLWIYSKKKHNMNLRRSTKYTAEVYTGSLNDIMFFLLLFFLIVSTLVNPSVIKLLLPTSSTSQALNKQQISLSVTADRKFYIDNTEIPFEKLETDLEARCKMLTNKNTSPTVVLRCDNSLTIQDLVDVLQIGNKLKIKMVLATKSLQK